MITVSSSASSLMDYPRVKDEMMITNKDPFFNGAINAKLQQSFSPEQYSQPRFFYDDTVIRLLTRLDEELFHQDFTFPTASDGFPHGLGPTDSGSGKTILPSFNKLPIIHYASPPIHIIWPDGQFSVVDTIV